MKMQWMIPVMLGTAIFLNGCGRRDDLTIQENAVPVVPAETAVSGTTVSGTHTDKTTANDTGTTDRQTAVTKTETSSVTGTTVSAAGAAETAASQSKRSNADSSGDGSAVKMLYGKWETVSFSKDSGERVSYDLSNPVHRSYYVGLELNASGQSSLTLGTEGQPATTSMHDNILTVDTVSLNHPVSMAFTVSADRTGMTAELMNGRIIVTLKRINRDFSIKDFLTAKPSQDAAALIGEWCYVKENEVSALLEIHADGSFTETQTDSNLMTTGTVKAENDGYAFYDSDNQLYLRFTPDPLTPDTYQDDDPGDGTLIRAYEQPNDWGYYDPLIYPASSISVAALCGIWKNADGSGEMLEIYEGRSIYHGRFELTGADGKVTRGDIRLQFQRDQDGEKEYCFTFYDDGGEGTFALKAVDTVQLTDLYGFRSDETHYIRQE